MIVGVVYVESLIRIMTILHLFRIVLVSFLLSKQLVQGTSWDHLESSTFASPVIVTRSLIHKAIAPTLLIYHCF